MSARPESKLLREALQRMLQMGPSSSIPVAERETFIIQALRAWYALLWR